MAKTTMKKIKEPTLRQYKDFIYQTSEYLFIACKKCGWPCRSGYCCTTCGCSSPTSGKTDKCSASDCKVCNQEKSKKANK